MFKAGDSALILATDKITTVLSSKPARGRKFPADPKCPPYLVETVDGIFDESKLHQAHPTVLFNMTGQRAKSWYDKKFESPEYRAKDEKRREREAHPSMQALNKAWREAGASLAQGFDVRGHFRQGNCFYNLEDFVKREIKTLILSFDLVPVEDMQVLADAISTKTHLDRWVPLSTGPSSRSAGECFYCGTKKLVFECNGVSLRYGGDECSLPEGFPPNEWELNVPSGKLVVANDLREWFPLPEGDEFDVNTVHGTRATTTAYANVGLSHAFVGNTCPGVYLVAPDTYNILCAAYDDDYNSLAVKGKRVAGISTDLWWYSLCDLNEFKLRLKKFKGTLKSADAKVIKIKPGVYRFRHFDDVNRDSSEETVFSSFEWVREADPVRPLLQELEQVEVTAYSYMHSLTQKWPTLYCPEREGSDDYEDRLSFDEMNDEQKLSCWVGVADSLFTHSQRDDWHEKGFPLAAVDPSLPDVDPPALRHQRCWYPFYSYPEMPSGFERSKMAPSFAKLAFRSLESIISFGIASTQSQGERYPEQDRERMLLAVLFYRKLAKRYPKLADPEYVRWLRPVGRAEAWVSRFNLGPPHVVLTTQEIQDKEAVSAWLASDAGKEHTATVAKILEEVKKEVDDAYGES